MINNTNNSTTKVRVRIAPSPTGFPHIGTIYQALFNYSYARKRNGECIVRIEDTDKERYVKDAEDEIFKALDWFNLIEDESSRKGGPYGPYRQSERLSIYQKYAKELIDKGFAYYCFCSKQRLSEVREKMQKEGKQIMYDKFCRNLSKEEVQIKLNEDLPYVVRLKVPDNEEIIVKDEIRTEILFNTQNIDDQVLLKSDGFPTYHLAVVVDDHLMKITHVVRAEEWLSSTPKHVLLYRYFGWDLPLFFHTPTLRNPDKSKISKRHGHTNVNWYKEEGFLPEAILNFLAHLGWTHPEQKEIFSLEEFINLFDLKDIRPVAPIFDLEKLKWLNGEYIRKSQISNLKIQILERYPELSNINDVIFDQFLELAKTRMQTLKDFVLLSKPLTSEQKIKLDDKEKTLAKKLLDYLSKVEIWKKDEIFLAIKNVLKEKNIKMPVIYKIITGQEKGLPLPESLEIVGKEKTLKRIKSVL
ncbi:MAG: glutamate--tRNA ligase [bacterium]|nr:glutamate--tRNA ligase [bacterium]